MRNPPATAFVWSPASTRRIVAAFAAILGAAVADGSSVPPTPLFEVNHDRDRVTRACLRPDGGSVYSANFLDIAESLPPGAPARVTLYSTTEVRLLLAGNEYTLWPAGSEEFPEADGIQAVLEKYFAAKPEDLRLADLGPPEYAAKAAAGDPALGMTKEQVYVALGPPFQILETPKAGETTETVLRATRIERARILASDQWIYRERVFLGVPREVRFYFGDGRLQKRVP
jgi:hypothetical protein